MKISIISPVYENKEQPVKFLKSVERALKNATSEYEVLIVDDGSRADLEPIVKEFSFARFIKLAKNEGPAAARNRGALEARGEYFIFFDSDTVLKEDALKLFEDSFKKGDGIVVGEYAREPLEKGFFPTVKSVITRSWTPKSNYVSVFALRAAGIKKEIFDSLGGFDRNIKTASVEDFEFGDRLTEKGHKILYRPDILVYHHHPSFAKQFKLFYKRSRDLTALLIKRNFKPYDWCASPEEGMSSVSGAAFIIIAIVFLISKDPVLFSAAVAAFTIFILSNMFFIKAAFEEKKILFIPAALLAKLFLSQFNSIQRRLV